MLFVINNGQCHPPDIVASAEFLKKPIKQMQMYESEEVQTDSFLSYGLRHRYNPPLPGCKATPREWLVVT